MAAMETAASSCGNMVLHALEVPLLSVDAAVHAQVVLLEVICLESRVCQCLLRYAYFTAAQREQVNDMLERFPSNLNIAYIDHSHVTDTGDRDAPWHCCLIELRLSVMLLACLFVQGESCKFQISATRGNSPAPAT